MQRGSRPVLPLSLSLSRFLEAGRPLIPSSSSYTKVLAAIMDSAAPKLGVLFYPL